ncbi:hypothetical protein AAVH_13729 [Aphelenchoides avenae]|nr:hypothetical protein AAVH_13729 [Aphelenchus avenae]
MDPGRAHTFPDDTWEQQSIRQPATDVEPLVGRRYASGPPFYTAPERGSALTTYAYFFFASAPPPLATATPLPANNAGMEALAGMSVQALSTGTLMERAEHQNASQPAGGSIDIHEARTLEIRFKCLPSGTKSSHPRQSTRPTS